jgi:hypothetical protein
MPDSQRSRLATIFWVNDSVPREVDPNRPGLGVHRLERGPPLGARLAPPGDGLLVEPHEQAITSRLATNGFVQPHGYSSAITSATGSTLADLAPARERSNNIPDWQMSNYKRVRLPCRLTDARGSGTSR